MNALDLILLLPVLYGTVKGFKKGFIKEFIAIAWFALSGFVAYRYNILDVFETHFGALFSKQSAYRPILSFVFSFFFVVVSLYTLGYALEKALKTILLGWVNRVFGALFGGAKYVLIGIILVYFFGGILHGVGMQFDLFKTSIVATTYLNSAQYALEWIR